MKKIIVFLLLSYNLFSQNSNLRVFHGSFIESETVFNYEFIANPGVGYSFKLMPLQLRDPSNELNTAINRINKTDEKVKLKPLVDEITKTQAALKTVNGNSEKLSAILKGEKLDDFKGVEIKSIIESLTKLQDSLKKYQENVVIALNPNKSISTKNEAVTFLSKPKSILEKINEIDKIAKSILSKPNINSDVIFDKYIKEIKLAENAIKLTDLIIASQEKLDEYISINNQLIEATILTNAFTSGKSNIQEVPFFEFTEPLFAGILSNQLKQYSSEFHQKLASTKSNEKTNLENLQTRLFYILQTRMAFEDEKPLAAIVMLKNSQVMNYTGETNAKPIQKHKIKDVTLEFEDGVIKNIEVITFDPNDESNANSLKRFRNIQPFGITGKFHPDKLRDGCVFYRTSGKRFETIKLSDLIGYYPVLRTNTENYAPENTVIKLIPAIGKTVVELEKEKTSEILDVQIFSDLAGLRIGNPQGLLQTSFSRKIDLLTRHFPIRSGYQTWSYLRYIKPEFSLTKIDQKDQNYVYKSTEAKKLISSTLIQYQFIRFGAELSLFKYNYPNAQLNFQVIASAHWLGSNIIDSDSVAQFKDKAKSERLFSNIVRAGILLETKPEGRWGANLKYLPFSYHNILNSDFGLYKNGSKKATKTLEFNGFMKTSPTNKYFFRWAYNYVDRSKFFHQLQIGVQSNLQRYNEENGKR